MPIIKSAKKKLRKDLKRTVINKRIKDKISVLMKKALKEKKPKTIENTVSFIDKAVKNGIIHKNKASRLKSYLSNLKSEKKVKAKTVKTKKITK